MIPLRPDLTVVMCTYNGGQHVREQLESIIGQSVRPGWLLVMDDSSTDDTVHVIREFFNTSSFRNSGIRTRLSVSAVRQGFIQNFARGMAEVETPLLALADQDDRWEPKKLETQLRYLDADASAVLVTSDVLLGADDLRPLGGTLRQSLKLRAWEEDALGRAEPEYVLIRRNISPGMAMMSRTRFVQGLHPFPARVPHDQWMSACAAALGGYRYIGECLVTYRIHPANQIGAPGRRVRSRLVRRLQYYSKNAASDGARTAEFTAALAAYIVDRSEVTLVTRRLVARAVRFEESRRKLQQQARLARIPAVVRSVLRGDYSRLATAGVADSLWDLIRPPLKSD